MAVAATRTVAIVFTTPVGASLSFPAASNANSPASVYVYTLASGANTISFPTGCTVVAGATIIPPSGNTNAITLKGTTGDTGVALHKTDPTSIAFDTTSTTQTSIVLTVATTTTGLRIAWT